AFTDCLWLFLPQKPQRFISKSRNCCAYGLKSRRVEKQRKPRSLRSKVSRLRDCDRGEKSLRLTPTLRQDAISKLSSPQTWVRCIEAKAATNIEIHNPSSSVRFSPKG